MKANGSVPASRISKILLINKNFDDDRMFTAAGNSPSRGDVKIKCIDD